MAVSLPTVGVPRILLSIIVMATLLAVSSAVPAGVAPDREITVTAGQQSVAWKQRWDEGRRHVRDGDFEQAREQYRQLVAEKPQIEAAKWEYCRVLFALGEHELLGPYLESLIEESPYNLDYLGMAGLVAFKAGEYEKSLDWLGQVYSAKPEGEEGVEALTGLVGSLLGLGRTAYAFPLMEQLYQRRPDQPGLLRDLAETAQKLGYSQKARDYYLQLMQVPNAGDDLLPRAAEAMLAAGDTEGAVGLWQQMVERNPANLQYRKKLADHYLSLKHPELALPHLLYLIDHQPDYPAELLLTSGRIYYWDIGRADKALRLFERYLENMPEHHEIRTEIEAVRNRISEDLLAIAENGGAEQLWRDLQEITAEPLVIFAKMADRLEAKNRYGATIDILEVALEHTQEDKDLFFLRLASLYAKKGDKKRSYSYYSKVAEKANRNESWYRKMLLFERELGMDRRAYRTLEALLAMHPDSMPLLVEAVTQAGILGFADELHQLGKQVDCAHPQEERFDLYLLYGRALRQVGAISQAEQLYNQLLGQAWLEDRESEQIMLEKAALQGEAGLIFEQQQVYRQLMAEEGAIRPAILGLFDSSLANRAVDDAAHLYTFLLQGEHNSDPTVAEERKLENILAFSRLSEAQGQPAQAIIPLEEEIGILLKKSMGDLVARRRLELETELCRLYIETGAIDKCRAILARYREDQVMTTRFLANIVRNRGDLIVKSLIAESRSAQAASGSLTSLFTAADLAQRYGYTAEAEFILEAILAEEPRSVRAELELARLYMRNGNWNKSLEAFNALSRKYPDDPYYHRIVLELGLKQGQYARVVEQTTSIDEGNAGQKLQLIRARALWGADFFEEALALYEKILARDVNEVLQQELTVSRVDYLPGDMDGDLFWGLFYYDLTNRLDNLNRLDRKDGFLALLKTDGGKIVANLYSDYRYEKLVKGEYLARKAIAENRYIAAKKQYQRTLKEEQNPEAMIDLAKVYQRLGDFGKEAEVYSTLAKQGETTPEVEESMERNRLARAPRLGAEYEFLKREGREGAIDIIRQDGGVGLRFPIHVANEIRLHYHELNYSRIDESESIDGRQVQATGWWDVTDRTALKYELGFHILDSEGDTTLLYDVRLDQNLRENASAFVAYGQEVVSDTLESLNLAIDVQRLDCGVKIETDSGFSAGGEFSHLWYNDDNSRNRFGFWSDYSLFSQVTTFTFAYNFELLQNDIVGEVVTDPLTGETSYSLPYWSPDDYRVHRISTKFEHLLKNFPAFKEDGSYYSFEFAVGLEAEENVVLSTRFDIFLEMSDEILLKGDVLYSTSDEYDESRAALSLIYRW